MPAKKRTLQEKMHEGEAVETQTVAAEIDEELKAPKAEPAKVAKATRYVAVKAFELSDVEKYEEGEEFVPPKSWSRDMSFEEFRGSERKNRDEEMVGVAFIVPGEIIDKKTGERAYLRQILPVKEA